MKDHLIIRCKQDATVDWLIESDGQIKAAGENVALSAVQIPVGHYKIYLLAPTELVGIHHLRLPKMPPARLLQAVPYALEDQFVDDIQDLHFAIGAIHKDQPLTVAAIKKAWMEQWLSRFKEQGLHIDALIPEVFTLPYEAGQWTILLTPTMGYARLGTEQGFAADPATLLVLLEMNLKDEEVPSPRAINLYSAETSSPIHEAFKKHVIPLHEYTFDGQLLSFFASQLRLHPPFFNMLQGQYRTDQEMTRLKKIWMITGFCLLGWAVTNFGVTIAQDIQLSHQSTQLNTEIQALFKKDFPHSTVANEPQVQMQKQLDSLKNAIEGGPFLSLLGKAGKVISENSNVQIKSLTYQANELDLTLDIATFNNLQTLVQQMNAAGLSVNESSAQTNNRGVVEAQLTIKSAGAS